MPKIMITSGNNRGKTYELSGEQVLGRHPQCEIVLNDMHASRRHAKAVTVNGKTTISDMGSSNGTYVNGVPVQSQELKDGDEICISSTFFLFIDSPIETPASSKRVTLGNFQPSAAPAMVPQKGAVQASSGKVKVRRDAQNEDIAFDASMDAQQSLIMGLRPAGPEAIDHNAALAKATQRLETLVELGIRLANTTEIDTMLNTIMDRMFEIFTQADRGFLMMNTDGTVDGLDARVIRNRDLMPGQEPDIEVSTTVLREALTNKKAILYSDASGGNSALAGAVSLATLQIRSVMCVPLLLGDELLGVVYIDTKDRMRAFTQDDMGLLAAVTTQAAISIKNSQMAQQMAHEAELRNNMARYLAPELVEKYITGEMTLTMGGEHKIGTVFFSDLIGFSTWSLPLPPEEVMDLLNQYFSVMEDIIFDYGGTIDKFMGDAIMAVWGVLVPMKNAPIMAVAAAMEMQNRQYVLSNRMRREGKSIPGMGIGLNTGAFVAGNLGSEQKIEYTVLGKNVNMGQRLESMAGYGQVFISEGTYNEIRANAIAIQLPNVSIKGWSEPVPAYCVRGLRVEREDQKGEKQINFILSLPIVTRLPADWPRTKPDYIGVITRAYPTQTMLTFEIWAWEPAPTGRQITVQPFIQEKVLPPLKGTVGSCDLVSGASMGEYYRIMLRITQLPPEMQKVLRVGGCTPSDWKEIVSAFRA